MYDWEVIEVGGVFELDFLVVFEFEFVFVVCFDWVVGVLFYE